MPVSDYSDRKDKYLQALLGKHFTKLFNPDGSGERQYRVNVKECKILPQPMGTVFDRF